MNRQQRRSKHRPGPELINAVTAEVLERRARDHATSAIIASLLKVMHDKHGWGHTRLTRLMDDITDQFECVSAGTVSLEDLKQLVEDELGIKLA